MHRRQLVTLGIGSLLSAVAGCVDTESAVEPEASDRNSADGEADDSHTDNGSATDTDDRCMDDVHAVIVDDSDVPDEATVIDLSTEQFDHRSSVRRAIEDAAAAPSNNGGVTICREEYEELHDTFGQLLETRGSDREQQQPGTMYFDHNETVTKVVLEAND